MTQTHEPIEHRRLRCGLELAVQPLPHRPLVAIEFRFFAGYAFEAPEHLGVAHLLDETVTKGTEQRDGRALNDAFDAIGATHGSYAGRETIGFSSLCLPEFLEPCIDLHVEFLRTPTFPDDACQVAVELATQELAALEDEPSELAKKLLHHQAYGQPLGRHALGETTTLDRLGREQIVDHWRRRFTAGRMHVAIAGAIDPEAVADRLERAFEGFGADGQTTPDGPEPSPPAPFGLEFTPGSSHRDQPLEQEQVAICFPGTPADDNDSFPVEKVLVGVLAGGMSSRLFTEVREKQGLVYWVDAWGDHPRGAGVIHLAASATPPNLDRTYETLLQEIDRLADDVTQQEIERVVVGIVARTQTRGDVTRARTARLADDLFYFGRPIPLEEKLARIRAVTVSDIKRYLDDHPRDQLSVVTVGPRELKR